MALSILDGNQSATTLSTILSSGQHITAHTVVSLGTQAITDIVNATSANLTNTQLRASAVTVGGTVTVGNSLTISSLPAISGTVTANGGTILVKRSDSGAVTIGYLPIGDSAYSGQSGAVVVMGGADDGAVPAHLTSIYGLTFPISGTVTIGSALPAGTNRIGVVTIGAGTVTIGAGTAQIGSVTVGNSVTIGSLPAISGTVTANLGNVAGTPLNNPPSHAVRIGWADEDTLRSAGVDSGGEPLPIQIYLGNSSADNVTTANPLPISGTVTIGSALPAGTNRIGVVTIGAGTVTIGAGTAQIGSVTASISGTVPISISSVTVGNSVTIGSLPAISGTVTANTFALQGTAVTTSNFTSTTASTVLANYNATREVLTIFNEGAGNLHICAGATCTTIAYQVRLSAGDYYEVPNHQTTITHSAVFATAGTARVCQVS